MKKTILMFLGLALMSIQSFGNTRAQALLLHNGQGKSFDADQLQEAVDEAVDGDTIYLSEGAFLLNNGTLTIDKAISIIGAGAEVCKIGGNVNIAIDGNPTLDRYLLDAVKIDTTVTVCKSMKGVYLRKCWIGNFFQVADDAEVSDIQIDRSYIYRFYPALNMRSATLINSIMNYQGYNKESKIRFVEGHDINFINCNIYQLDCYNYLAATYQNCMIFQTNLNSPVVVNNTFINTLFHKGGGWKDADDKCPENGNVRINCYSSPISLTVMDRNNAFPDFTITKEDRQSKGFLGTDGTVVGADGGATPFSMQADGLRIKESILRVDPDTRQLNVTLKVEKQ